MGWRDLLSAGLVAVASTLRTESISAQAKAREPKSGPREREFSAQKAIIRQEWEVGDDQVAWSLAEQGQLQLTVQLIEATLGDGVVSGLLDTRSSGLLKLPVMITGDEELVSELTGGEKNVQKARSGLLWKMFPLATLARIIQFGIMLGAGIGYFVQGEDDPCPVLHVIEHQFLIHRRDADGIYHLFYRTATDGEVEIVPGDGRWFVLAPYGWHRFWMYGKWRAVGRQWLLKNASQEQRETWGNRLARGIIWVTAPNSSNEDERSALTDFLSSVITPPVLTLLQGWSLEVKDVQGRGFEVWKDGKEDADNEIRMALSGQLVTGGGQTLGFGSGSIFADISQTLIDANAEALAESVHDHGLEPWAERRGLCGPWVEWDTTAPSDKKILGEALSAYGKGLSDAAKGQTDIGTDAKINVRSYAAKMGIELEEDAANDDGETRMVSGIKVRIEWPEGSIREGVGANGVPWQTLMAGASYGEIPGTESADGEALDVYVGPFGDAREAYVLEQLDFYGRFDEYKIFLGFFSLEHAQETFRRLSNPDNEGSWSVVPAELLAGMASGKFVPDATEQQVTESGEAKPVSANGEENANLFAYYLTSDLLTINEARAAVGQPYDKRVGDMYPSEWAAKLRADSAKNTGIDPGSNDPLAEQNSSYDKSGATGADDAHGLSQQDKTIAASDDDDEAVDPPANEDSIALADYMTTHKIDRCEHGRVNGCDKCGVERKRVGIVGPDGKHAGWDIVWRAKSPVPAPQQIT